MERFLKDVLVFLSGLLIISLALDFFISKRLRDSSGLNMVIWRDVMEGKASAELLICGDSRANTDCCPPVIDSITGLFSYSIGVSGQHFSIEKLRYDMYRRFNDKPSVVVQLVDCWFFLPVMKYYESQLLPWMWNTAFLKDAFKLEPRYFARKSFPFLRYHHDDLSGDNVSDRKPIRGFLTFNPSTFSRYNETSFDFFENHVREEKFRTYLSDLLNDGIKVVLVQAPICGSLSFKDSTLATTRDRFGSIAEEYGIPFLDYLQRPVYEDSTLFIDSVHLNQKGAVVFSDSLANDLISLGIIKD